MPSDAICVLHTQIPREPRTEPNEPRFRKILLGLVSVYWLLISVRSRSRPRSKKPDRYRFEPPNRYRAPSSLGSFAGLITFPRAKTAIDLVFGNNYVEQRIIKCRIAPHDHGSDHKPVEAILNFQ